MSITVPLEGFGGGKLPTPEKIGALSMELRWKNASPDSVFLAQIVSADLSDGEWVAIVFRTTSLGGRYIVFLPKEPSDVSYPADVILRRRLTAISDAGITFDKGQYLGTYGNYTTYDDYNDYLVPLEIYIVKGVSA